MTFEKRQSGWIPPRPAPIEAAPRPLNYEALGRYTEACEQVASGVERLNRALSDLARCATDARLDHTAGAALAHVDFAALRQAVDTASAHYTEALRCAELANAQAPLCARPSLKIGLPQTTPNYKTK